MTALYQYCNKCNSNQSFAVVGDKVTCKKCSKETRVGTRKEEDKRVYPLKPDECFPATEEMFKAAEPKVAEIKGQLIVGTGDDFGNLEHLKEMFYEPENYNLCTYGNGASRGFFTPKVSTRLVFMHYIKVLDQRIIVNGADVKKES